MLGKRTVKRRDNGQSMIELALILPLLVMLFIGLVEVAFFTRTYLALLEASREGARVGARGTLLFDNSEIRTLVTQDLSREGHATDALQDVIIVRAEVDGGAISSYAWESMMGSGLSPRMTEDVLNSRLHSDDPNGALIVVEIFYDHEPLINFPGLSDIFPDPMVVHTYSVMRLLK
jgi:hypothetical protein